MSEQNIYQEHYELTKSHATLQQSLQNIYNALFPHVAVEGVQLSLQEIIDLTVQKLTKVSGEVAHVAEEAVEAVEEALPIKKSRAKTE